MIVYEFNRLLNNKFDQCIFHLTVLLAAPDLRTDGRDTAGDGAECGEPLPEAHEGRSLRGFPRCRDRVLSKVTHLRFCTSA